MKIKFTSIKIENFKSIDLLETKFGEKTLVYGANETGKTSFADAISWCLTGKNSLGDSQFNFVPIEKSGVSPSVTLEIGIEDKGNVNHTILQRVYQAKQNKSKEYTGEYQTVCYVNKLKVGVKEFEGLISIHICDSEIFRLIHDVRYFTENIATNGRERPWEAQRRLLFSIIGVKADIDFARSKKRFEPILEGLQKYDTASQYLNYLKSEEKRLVDEIRYHNARIESSRSLLEDNEDCDEDIDSKIAELRKNVDELDNQIEEDAKRLREERDKKLAELNSIYNEKVAEFNKKQEEYSKKLNELNKRRKVLSENNLYLHTALSETKIDLKNAQEDYANINIQCPTCGQYMPTEMVEEKKNELESLIKELQEKVDRISVDGKNTERELSEVEKELSALTAPTYPEELRDIQEQITDTRMMETTSASGRLIAKMREQLIENLNTLIKKQSTFEKNKNIKKQIASIETLVSELLDSRAENSRMMDLVKEFIDAKCKYAEKKINELVLGVEFKLFRKNKTNEEIQSCCDLYWNGTPYASLSYSTKFIVSMNIALAFQKHYKVEMPILVDNAESINFSDDIPTQSILLVKREEYCTCGYMGETTRKEKDGLWTCKKCGKRFKKTLEIVTE